MKTLGIIGTSGAFGAFLFEKLSPHFKIKTYNRNGSGDHSLEDIAGCNYIIPSIPLKAYAQTFSQLAPHIAPSTVVVDVCSVKEKPIEIIQHIFPKINL